MIERDKPIPVRILAALAKVALAISAALLCGRIMVALIETIG